MKAQQRIVIFDSLRAYCALWVAFDHMARLSPIRDMLAFSSVQYSVEIFFILSGYVIADLLQRDYGSYRVFVFRRYMRLAPIFIFFCVLYLLQTNLMVDALLKLDTGLYTVREQIGIYGNSLRNWHLHLPSHVTLLHGMFDSWIPHSSKAILLQGWSISVEWQFYLLAPLLFFWVKNNKYTWLVFALVSCVLWTFFRPIQGVYVTDHITSFLAGIFSFRFLHNNNAILKNKGRSIMLVLVSIILLFIGRVELAIWSIFLVMAYGDIPAAIQRTFYLLFENKIMQLMGRISYSFFLCHMLTFFYSIHLVSMWVNPAESPMLFWLYAVPIALAIGIIMSALTYRYIEEPLIRWSKSVTTDQAARRGT